MKKTDHEELPIQNGEIWESHFQTLFNKVQTDTNCKQNQTMNQLEKLELSIKDNQNPLDFPITDKELKEKNQKPPTPKSIRTWWDIKWNDKTHKKQAPISRYKTIQCDPACRLLPRHLESRLDNTNL